jgi:hypothetical protein
MKWLTSILDDMKRWWEFPPDEEEFKDVQLEKVEKCLELSTHVLSSMDELKQAFENKGEWRSVGHVESAKLIINKLHQMILDEAFNLQGGSSGIQ